MTSALLQQIVRGLDGVTAGPWYPGHLGSDSTCQCRSIVDDGTYMGAIASVHVGNGLPIGEGGNDAPPAEEAAANMRHIARCSPDTMREIAAYVRETEARATAAEATVTALQEALAKAAEALEPFAEFADGTVDEIGWTDARPRERISTWFGPSDFRRARTAYTTIRRT